MKINRRDFLKLTGVSSIALYAATRGNSLRQVFAAPQIPGLSDPALQPKFANLVPNALDPGFIYQPKKGKIKVGVGQTTQFTGLVAPDGFTPVPTTVWGYGDKQFYTWPGRTFEVNRNEPLEVKW